MPSISPEALARAFHETYERLAPQYGYKMRKESAVPWAEVPEDNKQLMIAVCKDLLNGVLATPSTRSSRTKPREDSPSPQGSQRR